MCCSWCQGRVLGGIFSMLRMCLLQSCKILCRKEYDAEELQVSMKRCDTYWHGDTGCMFAQHTLTTQTSSLRNANSVPPLLSSFARLLLSLQAFALMIQEEYRVNMLLDNLPIAMTIFNQMGTTPLLLLP